MVGQSVIRVTKSLFDSNELAWTLPLPPWAPATQKQLRSLRRIARKRLRIRLLAQQGWLRTVTQTLAWPIVSILKAGITAKDHPVRVSEKARLFATYCWLQWAHNLRIADQDQHALMFRQRWPSAADYMACRENQALIDLLIEGDRGTPSDIHHKTSFARFCAEYGLPSPPMLSEGRHRECRHHAEWPKVDLLLKPGNWGKGKGIEWLCFDPATQRWLTDKGTSLGRDSIAAYAADQLHERLWLVQPLLRNHYSWRGFTAGALATVRIVTGYLPGNDHPTAICSFVRFPRKGSRVDNLSTGGIGAWVDMETHRMSAGFTYQKCYAHYPTHPDTGAQIEGVTPPGFADMIALATKAHRCTKGWPSLGWDVAITESGPMLIEANVNWAVIPRLPLATSSYNALMTHALAVKDRNIRQETSH